MPDKETPEPKAAPKKAEHRTVDELAKALGEFRQPGPYEEGSGFSARHAAAAQLHGWALHAHHAGEPMRLSEADYRAALEAASPAKGNGVPHKAALSKHSPHSGG